MFQVDHLFKNYQQKTVLTDIQLTLPPHKLIAFIGPNGAGKSTLLSILSRLTSYDIGHLYLEKTEVKAWKSQKMAKKLSILKQNTPMTVKISVEELVNFGRFPYSQTRLTKKDQEIVKQALLDLGLYELKDQMIDTLSGGQLQRVFIAMILAQDTPYILLDEPLNNLDINYSIQLMNLLKKKVQQDGKTILLVIHDLNFAAAYSEEIVAMKEGKIFAQGKVAEIITSEHLTKLYETTIKVVEIEGKPVCLYF